MELADNKFKNQKIQDKWNAPSEEEEKIIASQAEIKSLKKKSSIKQEPKASSIKKEKSKKVTFDDKKDKDKEKKPAWFNKEPKAADLTKPRTWNNKQWWWCSPKTGGKCDGKHRIHKPSKCEGKQHVFNASKRKEESKKDKAKRLKLSKSMEAIAKENEEESE